MTSPRPSGVPRPRIGLSPRLMRNLPPEIGFRGKTLQYLEQSVARWIADGDALVLMVPTLDGGSDVDERVADYVAVLDGLVLQGGADIDPVAYGESPSPRLQATDLERDRFELALLRAFVAAGKPVLGICRGMQLINVAFGGSLHQDLIDCGATDAVHVAPTYDEHAHALAIEPGSWLATLYPDAAASRVNSIHHQGINRLAPGLEVQARSEDGVVECVRATGAGFVVGVQWHPEFHDGRFPALLPGEPMRDAFLAAARASRRG